MRHQAEAKPIPRHLQEVRGALGDAGIPHGLHYSKMGWPYIRFDSPHYDGPVSVQYRAMIRDRQTKVVTREAHYLVYFPMSDGRQGTRSCEDLQSLMDKLGIDDERVAEGRVARDHLSLEDRAVSVVDPLQEDSLIASMRR
ncbi:hypothetical protein G6L37_01785 [Agrobacterium rubi]|nr:hypothetical protein [Agrobacterium rubi]NTF24125.1 hypothetical protein [Agrobacterium rubi]